MSRPQKTTEPSDAILTLPNIVTFARLALIPWFVYLGVGSKNIAQAFIVGGIAGTSDFVDGKLARRLGQVSKLGIALDPLSDRLLVAAGAVIIIANGYAPIWAVILVVARDVLVLAAVPFVKKAGAELPPVSWWGKAATMGIMFAFGFWLGAHMPKPSEGPLRWMQIVGWICFVPGVLFSYYAAYGYAKAARGATSS